MTKHAKTALMLIAALGVSGCGGGGGGTTTNTAPQPIPGTNGLNYGFPGQQIDQAEGVEITQQSANVQGTTTSIAAGAITLGNGFTSSIDNGSGTVQIFGETVTITNGVGLLPSNGQTVNVIFDPSRSGTYAGAVAAVSYGSQQPGISGPLDGETHTVFGFETNPDTISGFDAVTGNVTYQGGFLANGIVTNSGGPAYGTELEGDIMITANFATNRASGTLDGTYNNGTSDIDVDLALGSTPITSNGFAGTLTCTAPCSSTSEIDATFYGPDADELGGVLALDVTPTAGEQYDGAGTFIIPRQ